VTNLTSIQDRAQERRRIALELIEQQVEAGTLEIRQASPADRKKFGMDDPEKLAKWRERATHRRRMHMR